MKKLFSAVDRRRGVVSLVALLGFFLCAGGLAQAATNDGVDLVVLVDQSGSMQGEGSRARNDPEGIRNEMVRLMLDLLDAHGTQNEVTHRVAVVSFGSTAREDLPLTPVGETTIEQMRRDVDTLKQRATMGNTHFLEAFRLAAQQFLDDPSGPRRRMLLLITDGAPYIDGIQVPEYKRDLRQFVTEQFPASDYLLKVIALNDQDSNYWDDYRGLWQELSQNNARKLDGNQAEIFKALLEEFSDLIGAASEHVPEEAFDRLTLPPYLESVSFNIYSGEEGAVEIYTHRGDEPLTAEDPNVEIVEIGRHVTTINVQRPEPGEWRIKRVNDGQVEVFRQLFFPRGELVRPDPDTELRQYASDPVVYRVLDGTGESLTQDPAYPLHLELALKKPDEGVERFEMIPAPEIGGSVFRTRDEIEFDQAGEYSTEVSISTRDIHNTPRTIFQDSFSRFFVYGASRIDCRIVEPQELSTVAAYRSLIFWPKPVDVQLEFSTEDGGEINLPAIFDAPISDVLDLQLMIDGNPLDALSELEIGEAGVVTGRIRGLHRLGRHELSLRANSEHLPARYNVRVEPSRLAFERRLLPLHWLQLVLGAAGLIFLLGRGGWRTFQNLRAPLVGDLYLDRLGGPQVCELPLHRRRHRMVIKDLPPQTQIKKILVRSRRGSTPGVVVTVIAMDKTRLLSERTILNQGNAPLEGAPFVLKYRA